MDSPIEALAFDHLSFAVFTVVNNLWTWIALLTAAVSFWRLRSSASASSSVISISLESHQISESESPDETNHSRSNSPAETRSERLVSSPSTAPSTAAVFKDDGNVTKGKFLVYFEDDRENDKKFECESEVVVAGGWECGGGCGGEWAERLVRMRMGDMGWYRYQDLTAINGNVVRLWDGVRTTQ